MSGCCYWCKLHHYWSQKYVVSAGSLNTPTVLANSGFKNKHIGRNLTLHPVTTVFGDFGREVQADHFHNSIMTAVCTQVDDLDGKAHGAKIETILNAPFCKLLSYHGEEAMSSEEIYCVTTIWLPCYLSLVIALVVPSRAIHTDRMHYMSITLSTNLTVMHFCKLC